MHCWTSATAATQWKWINSWCSNLLNTPEIISKWLRTICRPLWTLSSFSNNSFATEITLTSIVLRLQQESQKQNPQNHIKPKLLGKILLRLSRKTSYNLLELTPNIYNIKWQPIHFCRNFLCRFGQFTTHPNIPTNGAKKKKKLHKNIVWAPVSSSLLSLVYVAGNNTPHLMERNHSAELPWTWGASKSVGKA